MVIGRSRVAAWSIWGLSNPSGGGIRPARRQLLKVVSGATMVEFDNLPQNSRLLILATLELEIASEDCKNIFDLARKRYQTIDQVWRDVCKKTSLPRCTIPPRVTGTDYTAGAAANVFVFGDTSANVSVFGGAPANTKVANPAIAATPANAKLAGPTTMAGPAHAAVASPATIAASVTKASPAPAGRSPQKPNRTVALAIGLAAVLLLGIGVAVFAIPRSAENPYASMPTTVTRSNETARTSGNKPNVDTSAVAVPEGTVRRLDAINKAFSKQ